MFCPNCGKYHEFNSMCACVRFSTSDGAVPQFSNPDTFYKQICAEELTIKNKIKARLGSIPKSNLDEIRKISDAAYKLLTEDIRFLLGE